MAMRSRRNGGNGLDAWPGYVDALSTLLMVVMFVLLVFVLAQAFESVVLTQRNTQLQSANQTLTQERERNESLRGSLSRLNLDLSEGDKARAALLAQLRELNDQATSTIAERDRLAAVLKQLEAASAASAAANRDLTTRLAAETRRADQAAADMAARRAELAGLMASTAALTAQRDDMSRQASEEARKRAAAEARLDTEQTAAAEAKAQLALVTRQNEAERAALTARLNEALAAQVEELRKYRSDFFGKLRAVLADKPGITVVGDRFVFQSEVLFPGGSADLSLSGQAAMADLAESLRGIITEIPPEIAWVLRVDGHTDSVPVHTSRFVSNWELSSARAITVVKFLIARGIPARHLAAAGFGENQPVDLSDTPEAYARNRRIELRLTDR